MPTTLSAVRVPALDDADADVRNVDRSRADEPTPEIRQLQEGFDSWFNHRPTILIVDDDQDTCELTAMMLQREGFETVMAGSAGQAMEQIANGTLDAVLLDVMLPDGSGLDICQVLRSDAGLRDLPVIMMTALSDVGDEVNGILAGADGYLVKPVAPQDLMLRLREFI